MFAHHHTRVVRAVEVDTPELEMHAAPAGFPFLLQESAGGIAIIEPPTLFLFSKFLPIRRDPGKIGNYFAVALNSAIAVANDLKDWWKFLDRSCRAWRDADQEDFECYRDVMLSTISPHTGRKYRPTTVKRRMVSVLQFYQWAQSKRLCLTHIARVPVPNRFARPVQYQAGEATAKKNERNDVLPRTSYSHWEHVRVLSVATYQKVAGHIGALPTDAPSDSMDCQCRLGVELAIQLGLRINEVTGLTVAQIQSLGESAANSLGLRYLRIDRTKGNKPRKIVFPGWLVAELNHYIANQRRSALQQGRALELGYETDALLLNDARARQHCGQPLTDQTLRRKFGIAQFKSGLVRNITKHDPEKGKQSEVEATLFRFHDLRHTYAVWLYYAEKLSGNPEPWKTIQARLGHEYLSTTQDIYLRATAEFEAEVSDAMSADLAAGAMIGLGNS